MKDGEFLIFFLIFLALCGYFPPLGILSFIIFVGVIIYSMVEEFILTPNKRNKEKLKRLIQEESNLQMEILKMQQSTKPYESYYPKIKKLKLQIQSYFKSQKRIEIKDENIKVKNFYEIKINEEKLKLKNQISILRKIEESIFGKVITNDKI